jgi:fumarylacetoacetase
VDSHNRMTEFPENIHLTAKSWVESANDPASEFPLHNLPFCAFVAPSFANDQAHLGVGIGNFILDLHTLSASGHFFRHGAELEAACREPKLNALMSLGSPIPLRLDLWMSLSNGDLFRAELEPHLILQSDVEYRNPVAVANYTDFYASIHHATNVGKLFRPDQPLLPNYKWIPIGYHGRASSLVLSGTAIRRPHGQFKSPTSEIPLFTPSAQLDFELELAAYIGPGNLLGEPIPLDGHAIRQHSAQDYIFGYTLLNDWSARDIQSWEYQPLGPFLGKSFATTISPWVVTADALEPYRIPLATHTTGDPAPLPHLAEPDWMAQKSGLDIRLGAWLSTAQMRAASLAPIKLTGTNARHLYWSFGQMIAHHTSNGCNLQPGDLIASGTISGPTPDSLGSLLEITRRGQSPLQLPNGESRAFLEDGDEIILRGYCEREGLPRISLGECRGTILPAAPYPVPS